MHEIDSCTTEILRLLLQTSDPVSSRKISQSLGISTRAVQYRINRVKEILGETGLSLSVKPNFGILINGIETKKNILLEKLNSITFFPKEKRIYIILFSLLTSEKPLSSHFFEEILLISHSTVNKEIALAKNWFLKNRIFLNSKPNFGYWVEGEEEFIREAFFNCIYQGSYEFKQQNALMEYCFLGGMNSFPESTFLKMVENYFSEIDFYHLNKIIGTLFDVQLSDQSNYCLVLRLAILIKRSRQGNKVKNICPGLGDLVQKSEYHWAEFLNIRICKLYDLAQGLEEISFITKYLCDAQLKRPVSKNSNIKDNEDGILGSDLIDSVDQMVLQISTKLHPSLMLDSELKNNLTLHIKYILDRIEYYFPEDNAIIREIKEEYPTIFSIVEDSIRETNLSYLKKYPDEIGYITIHIATALRKLNRIGNNKKTILLVCNAGVASALLLKLKIEAEFPEIVIADVISYKELLKRKKFCGIDFVISTIPVRLVHAPPVLVVNILLKELDIDNLKKIFTPDEGYKKLLPSVSLNEGPEISALINKDLIELKKDVSTWQEAVYQAGKLLLNNGYIEKRYIRSMENVINEFGPFVVAWPGIALLHASCDCGAKHLGMSLITLAQPISFGHDENDPVDVVFALSIPRDKTIPLALDQLNTLLSSEKALKIFRTTIHKEIIFNLITKFGNQSASNLI